MANISVTDVPLACHPESDASNVKCVESTIWRSVAGNIELNFSLVGQLSEIIIPAKANSSHADGLWKTTCFELFIASNSSDSYVEYNFSPSGQWAAYTFASYRTDMAALETRAPQIATKQLENVLIVSVMFQLPETWQFADLQIGLSAVIATKEGAISYWALAHPPGKPDFHHKDCFALKLGAPDAA